MIIEKLKKLAYRLQSKFLTMFGDIKVFKWPFWMVYDPDDFEITGTQILDIMNVIKPGDIILRGYNYYLDGKFIPSKTGWSHGALYIGDNQVIHAVAQGVSYINVLDFLRCDRIAIFRPKSGTKSAIAKAKKFAKANVPYDFGFTQGVSALYCFELAACCYPKLDIPRKTATMLFGLLKKRDVFLADSFFDSPDLTCVYQFNPRFNIDFCKG